MKISQTDKNITYQNERDPEPIQLMNLYTVSYKWYLKQKPWGSAVNVALSVLHTLQSPRQN